MYKLTSEIGGGLRVRRRPDKDSDQVGSFTLGAWPNDEVTFMKKGLRVMSAWQQLDDAARVRVVDDTEEFERLCRRAAPGANNGSVGWNPRMAPLTGREFQVRESVESKRSYRIRDDGPGGGTYIVPFDGCILVGGDNWLKLAPSMHESLRKSAFYKEFDPSTEGYCMIKWTNGDVLLKPVEDSAAAPSASQPAAAGAPTPTPAPTLAPATAIPAAPRPAPPTPTDGEPFWVADPELLVGQRIRVLWARGRRYEGEVKSYDAASGQHSVWYDDGEKKKYKMATKVFWITGDDSTKFERGTIVRDPSAPAPAPAPTPSLPTPKPFFAVPAEVSAAPTAGADVAPSESGVDPAKCALVFKAVVSEAFHTLDEYRRGKWCRVGLSHGGGGGGGGGGGRAEYGALVGDPSELGAACGFLRRVCALPFASAADSPLQRSLFLAFLERAGVFYELYTKLLLERSLDVDDFLELVLVANPDDEENLCANIFGRGLVEKAGNVVPSPSGAVTAVASKLAAEEKDGTDGAGGDGQINAVEYIKSVRLKLSPSSRHYRSFVDTLRAIRSGKRDVGEGLASLITLLSDHHDLMPDLIHFVPHEYRGKARALLESAGATALTTRQAIVLETTADAELAPEHKVALRRVFNQDFVVPFADMLSGKFYEALKANITQTVRDAPLASDPLEHSRKLLMFMLASESVEEAPEATERASEQAEPSSSGSGEASASASEAKDADTPAAPSPDPSVSTAADAPPAGGASATRGTSMSRVQTLWAEVVSELVSDTLRATSGHSRGYVDRIHQVLFRLERLHQLFPRPLRLPGRRAVAAAFRRLRPVQTCAVVQHFHARLSALMDSLRQDEELGVPATKTRRDVLAEITDVLEQLDLGEAGEWGGGKGCTPWRRPPWQPEVQRKQGL